MQAYTKTQVLVVIKHQKPQSKEEVSLFKRHTEYVFIFLAYLVLEVQSVLQQVRGEAREANWWCLQLESVTEIKD